MKKTAPSIPLAILPLLFAVAPARAGVPDPNMSYVEPVCVGSASGQLSPALISPPSDVAGFTVIVRDVNFAPIPNVTVVVAFDVAGVPLQTASPGATTNCLIKTLSTLTDAFGYAKFAPNFGGSNDARVVEVSANGVVIGLVPARSTDIDAQTARCDVNDLNQFRGALFGATFTPSMDFDEDGAISVGDLGFLRLDLLSGVVGTYCP